MSDSPVMCGRGTYLARHRFARGLEACGDTGCDEVLPHRVEKEGDTIFVLGNVSKDAECLFLDLRIYIVDESTG